MCLRAGMYGLQSRRNNHFRRVAHSSLFWLEWATHLSQRLVPATIEGCHPEVAAEKLSQRRAGLQPCRRAWPDEGFRGCVRTGRETAGPSTSLRIGRDDKGGGAVVSLGVVGGGVEKNYVPQGRLRIRPVPID